MKNKNKELVTLCLLPIDKEINMTQKLKVASLFSQQKIHQVTTTLQKKIFPWHKTLVTITTSDNNKINDDLVYLSFRGDCTSAEVGSYWRAP